MVVDNPFVPFVEQEQLDLIAGNAQLKTFLVRAFHVQAFHEPAEVAVHQKLHVQVVRIQECVVEGIHGRRAVE